MNNDEINKTFDDAGPVDDGYLLTVAPEDAKRIAGKSRMPSTAKE